MNASKMVTGTLLCIAGVALGLYLGLWWALIGGIVDVVNAVKATDVSAIGIAIGVVKILGAGFIGGLSATCLIAPGAELIKQA